MSELDARCQAAAKGLAPVSVELVSKTWIFTGLRTKAFSLLLFSQELLALLGAGLSIVEAIEALHEKEAAPANSALFAALLRSLREGKRLSDCLEQFPDHFPALYVGILRAAERTSSLADALARFVDYQSRVEAVRGKIVSALIYPAVLLCVGTGVTLFLMCYVVPRFSVVYRGSGRDLPFLSSLLLDWGQLLSNHLAGVLIASALALAVLVLAGRRFIQRGQMRAVLQLVPVLRDRLRAYELERLYLTLGILLKGGLAIIPAIDLAGSVLLPENLARLHLARRFIQSGRSISDAFDAAQLTTPVAIRLLRVGERSGQIGDLMTKIATFYEVELARWMERFTRMFEPLLMMSIGLVVGTIVVLMYLPIFDLASAFQ